MLASLRAAPIMRAMIHEITILAAESATPVQHVVGLLIILMISVVVVTAIANGGDDL